jgi:hypothetical protein
VQPHRLDCRVLDVGDDLDVCPDGKVILHEYENSCFPPAFGGGAKVV